MRVLLIISAFFFFAPLYGQLSGLVTSTSGDTLAYVTIYSSEEGKGTVTNELGYYDLDLSNGKHTIIVKHLGYEDFITEIDFQDRQTLNVTLKERSFALEALTITAKGEDPAYPIIRKAIARRDRYYKERKKYTVDVYTKGLGKIIEKPGGVIGRQMGDMGGMLDSTGQGIVYLAESQSKYYFHQPDLEKEVVTSSVVAEGDDVFNINRFLGLNYDIYTNTFEFVKPMINPLADNALSWYSYKLLGLVTTEEGNQIYRIQVIPNNTARPLLSGELYIEDETWKVTQLDLTFSGLSIGEKFFKSINIKQIYHTTPQAYTLPISQVTLIDAGMFGFKMRGGFTYLYNNYDFGADIDPSMFGAEIYKMDEKAIKSDSTYWATRRPIALTQEERNNYILKDSLKQLWKSKPYLDSIDRKSNKFSILDIVTGYTYNDTYNKSKWSLSSPLSTYNFHPVSGHSIGYSLLYHRLDQSSDQGFVVKGDVRYGFSDKRFRWDLRSRYRSDRKSLEHWRFSLGDTYRQYGDRDLVQPFLGFFYAVMEKLNLVKIYRKQYAQLGYEREVLNGLKLDISSEYADRSPLANTSNFSFFNRDRTYEYNSPLGIKKGNDFFEKHTMWTATVNLKFKPFQKYLSYTSYKIRQESNWPAFYATYQLGLGSGERTFHKLKIGMFRDNIRFSLYGKSSLRLEAGTFVQKKNLAFIDQFHFMTSHLLLADPDRYTKGFKYMPYYAFSTDKGYAMTLYEHDFDGFLLGSIPWVKKLGWSIVVGANTLLRDQRSNYYEASVGLSNIKLFGVKALRVDYVRSFINDSHFENGLVVGLTIPVD